CPPALGFWAEVPEERLAAVQAEGRRPVLASGCGAVSTYLADPATVKAEPARGLPPGVEHLRALFKQLFAQGERYKDTGGIHAAALADGATLIAHAEDIGRHNAVDKAIGGALLAQQPITGLGLLVTGRISAELAFKAARAGIAWVATPSVPSTLAVEIARRSGMALVGRAVSGEPQVWRGERGAPPGPGGAGVTGAILGGGGATRFGGRPKGLERVGGVRILDRLVEVFVEALGAA